jgi:hypothetical protein
MRRTSFTWDGLKLERPKWVKAPRRWRSFMPARVEVRGVEGEGAWR